MTTFKSFLASLSSNGKQFVRRFIDYYDHYDIDDCYSEYLEFKLANAVSNGLISESESDIIFDYFTLHDN